MKSLTIILLIALGSISINSALGADVTITYAKPMPAISSEAMGALTAVLQQANITGCKITSTARTSAQQARVMYGYIVQNGADAAKKLYGSEGRKVVGVYVDLTAASNTKEEILDAMEKKIIDVLPAARAKFQLMHVDRPEFDVFDVAEASIPVNKRADLIASAKSATSFHRFLGPDEGEKGCYHFEFAKVR